MGYYSEHCPINESRQRCAQLIPRESDQRLVGPGFVSEALVWYMMFWMAIRWEHANSNHEWIVCLVYNVSSKLRILKLIHVNIIS